MTWPPDELWPKIAALWSTYGTPSASANERDKAFATLKQYQNDFGLSDCQLAFIAEHQILDPSSRIFKRERPEKPPVSVAMTLFGIRRSRRLL